MSQRAKGRPVGTQTHDLRAVFCAEVTSRIHIIYEMGTFIDTVAIVRDNIHEGMNGGINDDSGYRRYSR